MRRVMLGIVQAVLAAALLPGCAALEHEFAIPTLQPLETSVAQTLTAIPRTPVVTPTMVTETPVPSITVPPTETVTPSIAEAKGEIYAAQSSGAGGSETLAHFPARCFGGPSICSASDVKEVSGGPEGADASLPLAWSPDGTIGAAVKTNPAAVMIYTLQDGAWKEIASFDGLQPRVFWSPDGKLLAVIAQKKNKWDVYTLSPDGKNVLNLTQGMLFSVQNPLLAGWVGQKVVFTANLGEEVYLFGVLRGGPQPIRQSNVPLFRGYSNGEHPDAVPSPDGKWVAATETTPLTGTIMYAYSLQGGVGSRVLGTVKDGLVEGYAWSAKSDWLAYWVAAGGKEQVFLVRPDASEMHPVYETDSAVVRAVFSPAGQDLLLLETANSEKGHQLVMVPLSGGDPVSAADLNLSEGKTWAGVSWRP